MNGQSYKMMVLVGDHHGEKSHYEKPDLYWLYR